MKLISCYIETFGNIRQTAYNFSGGLSVFCENNGYGKTTLASFIKAMFYGFKTTKSSDRVLGERARFYPFTGGKFGGNVTVEKDGNTYKIERFFGEKSATEDTVTVYKNGTLIPSDGLGDLGKEFFGLDEQSFLRTVFINSQDTDSGATGDISRMLNGFVDDADFESAKKALEDKKKKYKALRGRGGRIDDKADEIVSIKTTIANQEKITAELPRKYEQRKALAKTIEELETRQNTSRDKNLVLQKWLSYDGIVADAEADRQRLSSISQKYPEGLPEEEEIQQLKRETNALNLANERHISATFSAEKEKRLAALSEKFAEGTPTDEEISSAQEGATKLIILDSEISSLQGAVNMDNGVKFPAGIPDGEEVKRYGEKLSSLRESKGGQPKKSGGKKIALILTILAVIALGAGVGMMFVKAIIGGILLGVGGALVLAGIFTYFKGQISGMATATKGGEALENEIRSYLARYGYYTDGGVEVDYNNLVRDLEIYSSNLQERDRNSRLLEEKRRDANDRRVQLNSFLEKYSLGEENMQAELNRLGALVAEYVALNEEKSEAENRFKASGAEIEEHTEKIDAILKKYSIERGESLASLCAVLERDRAEYDRLSESVRRLEKRASDYMSENGLKERPEEGEEDIRSIDGELSEKRRELIRLDREISDDESAVDAVARLNDDLERATEEYERLLKEHAILEKTIEFLVTAEGNLKDRYVAPVKNGFLKYSDLLEKVLGERVTFDKDFKVKFERGGENRSDEYLSAGQKSLCALCLRLALIDNMYKDDRPFIIMDDPFVHLDADHLIRAKALLKGLAYDRQIIYFCCHDSRNIQA